MHVTVALPDLLAVMVTVLPSGTAPADIAGVLSLVRSSVDNVPRSEAVMRSGAEGADGGVVSTEIVRPPVGPAVFPAGSVADDVIAQSPGASVPKSQLVPDGDLTYEHVTLALPALLAVIVIVSPSVAPTADTVGVVSFVTLSVDDEPLSDAATKSGVPAVVDVSTANGNGVDAFDTFPARSVCLAETLHSPSASVPRSQDDAFNTYEHDTSALPALLAVMVTVSPTTPDTGVADIVGVLSFVRLSVDDVPVSDDAARSTEVGAEGAVRSIVTVDPGDAEPGPVPPDALTIELAPTDGMTVPSSHPVALMVNVVVETLTTENVHPEAVPSLVISPATNDAGSIASEKTSVQSIGLDVWVGVA